MRDPTAFADVIAERAQPARLPAGTRAAVLVRGPHPASPIRGSCAPSPPHRAPFAGTLHGIGVCGGVASGPARVILDPADPRDIQPGDVLVAPITDPAWTPLFLSAAAVVVDVGAQQSHAAIVARELGIPAVVSVTGASHTIVDGTWLDVDGDRGARHRARRAERADGTADRSGVSRGAPFGQNESLHRRRCGNSDCLTEGLISVECLTGVNMFSRQTNVDRPTDAPRAARRLATASKSGPEDARRANRSLLLRALHHGGPTSRADLAKLTGLTPASVSSVVRELLEQELVEELGTRIDGGVGKPATLVGIRPDSRYVVCLDLSEPEQFVAALVDLTGKVVVRRSYARDERTGRRAETLVKRICDDLVADADRPLLGIGVASPGIVDDHGTVATAAHLGWTDLDLRGRLSAGVSVPVHVVNDANAAALAELVFGAGEAQNLILVRVDEGVGAGIVLDGALFTGNRSAAGEIGHVVIDEHGEPCACGKRGCLETVVSEPLAPPSASAPTEPTRPMCSGTPGAASESHSRRCSAPSTSATSCCRARRR